MKILIDLTSLFDNFSGIERYALSISKEMLKLDYKNKYVLLFKNSTHKAFDLFKDRDNIEFLIIQGKNKLLFYQIILPKYLYKIKADKYMFLSFPSPILFRKKGIFNTIHDLTAWDYPDTMKIYSRVYFKVSIINAINVSEKILTVSKFSKKRIEEKFKTSNVNIIYNGVSDVFLKAMNIDNFKLGEEIKSKYGLPQNYIMCLCTLEPRKNIKLLIKAYVELREKYSIKSKLVLVGRKGWKIDNLLNEINNKYSKDIIITGFVDDDDLPQIYKGAEVFVFPSLYEGFGIPVLEAISLKIPVISSNAASLPEVVGDAGILFENDDVNDLEKKILQLLNMSEADTDLFTKNGYKQVKKFEWRKEACKVLELLKN